MQWTRDQLQATRGVSGHSILSGPRARAHNNSLFLTPPGPREKRGYGDVKRCRSPGRRVKILRPVKPGSAIRSDVCTYTCTTCDHRILVTRGHNYALRHVFWVMVPSAMRMISKNLIKISKISFAYFEKKNSLQSSRRFDANLITKIGNIA